MANEVEIAKHQKNTAQYYKIKLKSNLNWYMYNWAIMTADFVAVHTKIDLSWIDVRSTSVRFEKVFTLI